MADIFIGVDRGGNKATIDSSTQNLDTELVVDNAVGVTKQDILKALKEIEKAVLETDLLNEI